MIHLSKMKSFVNDFLYKFVRERIIFDRIVHERLIPVEIVGKLLIFDQVVCKWFIFVWSNRS